MDSDIIIRESAVADDATVGELLVRAYTEQYARKLPEAKPSAARNEDLRNQAEKRATGAVLVAEHERRIVGTVALFPWSGPRSESWIPGAANLRYFAVDAAFRGRGLSGRLLDAAEERARASGATAICLHVRQGAEGVARLYLARGYRRDAAEDLDHRPEVFLEAYALTL
ncbi:MAG TPA: GNAT family N-acetyltransferase [Candidatus Cybelea sp.]|nr:GNAT family N-acetyltransferase [Candidatus Cybelea sp.]